MLEKIKGYKTMGFFALTLILSIAGMFGFVDYAPSGDEAEIIGVVLSIIAITLRAVTKTPVFKGE